MPTPSPDLAGQEGLEPTTYGFGIRRSTVRATGLLPFPMYGVFFTKLAIFLELKLVSSFLLILAGRVISSLAVHAFQTQCNAHNTSSKKLGL